MLTVSGFVARDVPIRHPAELFAFVGFQPLGQQGRGDFVIGITSAQLKVETNVKVASATTGGAFAWCGSGEVVQCVEQLLVRRIFLMTLNAVKRLRSHVRASFPGTAGVQPATAIATT